MSYLGFILKYFSQTTCPSTSNFLGLPNWYRNLSCADDGGVMFTSLSDLWVIIANAMDITLRLVGIVAVLFIIYGGIRYITSQGEPENLQTAKKIITNSIIGLVLAILASTIVGYIAGLF